MAGFALFALASIYLLILVLKISANDQDIWELYCRFRPGFDVLAYDASILGIRRALGHWRRWTRMRWKNSPPASFGPPRWRRWK